MIQPEAVGFEPTVPVGTPDFEYCPTGGSQWKIAEDEGGKYGPKALIYRTFGPYFRSSATVERVTEFGHLAEIFAEKADRWADLKTRH